MNCCKCNNSSLASFHRHNENLISFDFDEEKDSGSSLENPRNSDYHNQLNYYDYRCNVPDHQVQVYRQITSNTKHKFFLYFLCAFFKFTQPCNWKWRGEFQPCIVKSLTKLHFVVSFDNPIRRRLTMRIEFNRSTLTKKR